MKVPGREPNGLRPGLFSIFFLLVLYPVRDKSRNQILIVVNIPSVSWYYECGNYPISTEVRREVLPDSPRHRSARWLQRLHLALASAARWRCPGTVRCRSLRVEA